MTARTGLRALAAAIVAFALGTAMLPGTAHAQYRETPVGNVGGVKIISIIEQNGKFDRCSAVINGPGGMLRFAWNIHRHYFLSIPGVPGPVPVPSMGVSLDGGPPQLFTALPNFNAQRAAIRLPIEYTDRIFNARRTIAVQWAGRSYSWPINGPAMVNVFAAVEDCVRKQIERPSAAPVAAARPGAPVKGNRFYAVANPTLCADIAGARYQPGTAVILWTCHTGNNQLFGRDPRSGRIFAAANPDLCVDMMPGGLGLADCRQLGRTWAFNRSGMEIRSNDGQCWDVPGGRFNVGARLQSWPCHRKAPQRFSDQP